MFKRLMSFFSFFIILLLYLQVTSVVLMSGHFLALVVLGGLMVGFLSWLAIQYHIFDIHLMRKKDWLVLLVGIVVIILQTFLFSMLGRGGSGARDSIAQLDLTGLATVLSMTIIGPVMEEMLTRGILQKGAFDNSHIGILIASALFSWMHTPYTLVSFLSYFAAGVTLGYMYRVSDNILPSICLHILNNSLAYCMLVL